MTHEVEKAFVKQFESEVHHEFQKMGSKLRNTFRTKTGIVGKSTTFQTAGRGKAGGKSRHGDVPILNAGRDPVEVPLRDRYGAEYVDKLDELKVQHDERQTASQTIAFALGRDVDDIIYEGAAATTNPNNKTTPFTWSSASGPINDAQLPLGKASVPFDNNVYGVVGWEAWGDLEDMDEFSNQDYVPGDRIWFEGVVAKKWLGIHWFPDTEMHEHNATPNTERQFVYHKTAGGHAIGQDFELDVDWQGQKQAHLVTGCMSHGFGLIDDVGCIMLVYDSTPAP